MKRLRRLSEIGIDLEKRHLRGIAATPRCLCEEIEYFRLARRRPRQRESAATQRRQHGLRDAGGQCSGDRRIKRVSPCLENQLRGPDRLLMSSGNRAARPIRVRAVVADTVQSNISPIAKRTRAAPDAPHR